MSGLNVLIDKTVIFLYLPLTQDTHLRTATITVVVATATMVITPAGSRITDSNRMATEIDRTQTAVADSGGPLRHVVGTLR